MSIAVKQNNTPIKAIDTDLCDFSHELESYCQLLERKLEKIQLKEKVSDSEDEFVLFPGRIIRLRKEVCKHHNKKLTMNGTNKRTVSM
jgi:hypothetical protein